MLETLIFVAGILQVALVAGSFAIPGLLNWKRELSVLNPLIRQMFWTYAGYILVTNFSFGLLSIFAPVSLLDGSILAIVVSLFIGLYWTARIIIQFFYFDRKSAPKGLSIFLEKRHWLHYLYFFLLFICMHFISIII